MWSHFKKEKIPVQFIAFIIFISLLVISGGILLYNFQKNKLLHEKQNELAAISSLKVGEFTKWRMEHIRDGEIISRMIPQNRLIFSFLENDDAPELRQELLQRIKIFTDNYDYLSVMLADRSGSIRLSYPPSVKDTFIDSEFLHSATSEVDLSQLLLSDDGFVHMDVQIPLFSSDSSRIGAVIMRIDPYKTLFPLVQSWPTPSKSSETLLVRRDGDSLLFLNELRHRQNTVLKFKLPLSDGALPAAWAVLGYEGPFEGTDYRGIEVISYLRKIPGSPWFMVTKVDKKEIYSPLVWHIIFIISTVLLLIIFVIAITIYHWKNQKDDALRKSEEKYRIGLEQEVRHRTKDLMESQHLIQKITDTIPYLLYVHDIVEDKIIFVNKGIEEYKIDLSQKGKAVLKALLHPEDLQKRMSEIASFSSLKPGEIRSAEFRIKNLKGKWQWYAARDTFFRAQKNDDSTCQVLTICHNITDRIEVEVAFLEERSQKDELKRIYELMDTFVFAAAHDLKGPISNLILLTSIIESSTDMEERLKLQNKYSGIIGNLDRTLSGLIQVLEIEKEQNLEIKFLSLESTYNLIHKEFEGTITEINPEIHTDFSSCETIPFIEPYLVSIFRNIVGNSIKYRSSDRRLIIDIQCSMLKDYFLITFRDNGIGIDLARYKKHIFKPFWRMGKSDGSGIGLHLVRSMVERNGGRVEVESVIDHGTTFRIFLVPYEKKKHLAGNIYE